MTIAIPLMLTLKAGITHLLTSELAEGRILERQKNSR